MHCNCFRDVIAYLQYFIQNNWIGRFECEIEELVSLRNKAREILALNDQCNAINLELLYLSKKNFSHKRIQETYPSSKWWLIRANYIHQLILQQSATIYEETDVLIESFINSFLSNNLFLSTLFYLEAAQFYILYRRLQKLEKLIEDV